MKHLGDITKLNGFDMPVVDVITGGSPCQDLSVAGNRAGLAGRQVIPVPELPFREIIYSHYSLQERGGDA